MPGTESAPFTIGVLLCDHVGRSLQAAAGGDYDEVFESFLTTAANAVQTPVEVIAYDAINGELPDTTDRCDAWVITGSRHDAYTDEQWIVNLRHFIREVHEHRGRIAGVCFGHQLVATALGGVVEPTMQWKLGPQRLELDSTPWFEATTVHLHGMHRDVITQLPPDSEVIGTGNTAEIPAYLVGDNVLCVQDHPEFTAEYCAGLIQARSDRIDPETARAALAAIEGQPTNGGELGVAIISFLTNTRL